ncbi:hypothetical protein ENSA5_52320 [Enhygromyxa salina]|uniref:Uncharacterized protein n=1 Tax=Enhygromyxa salina TaxID=215803 RepID=A0A2S9XG96_9BACT|nr:hypothetical protein [Enhygromyxa salina]PRP91889.1 hypothetical protein ENSA5_52320 [Enhygromyxa salina]
MLTGCAPARHQNEAAESPGEIALVEAGPTAPQVAAPTEPAEPLAGRASRSAPRQEDREQWSRVPDDLEP